MASVPMSRGKLAGLIVVFLWFFVGGIAHFVATETEMKIVPPYIPVAARRRADQRRARPRSPQRHPRPWRGGQMSACARVARTEPSWRRRCKESSTSR